MQIPEKATKKSRRFNFIKVCIFLSGLSVFAQLYLFQPLLPTVADHFHTSVGDSSLLVSSSTIGMALGLFYFAFHADRFPRKNLMVFSLISSALLTIISAWIDSLPLLIGIGLVKGFVISGVSAVALAYLTEEVDITIVGLAISMYLSGNTIGGMSGRILATLLEAEFGWRNAILLIGIESLILGLIFWKFFPASRFFHPRKMHLGLKLRQMKRFVTDPYMIRLYLIAALLMGTFVSVYNYLSFRLEGEPFRLNHVFIASIFLMYTFGVFGTMITSRLSERIPGKIILKTSIVLMSAGILFLLTENIWILVVGLGIFTLAFFAAHTMASKMVALLAKSGKSSATSIYWLFYYFGSSVLGSGSGYFLHGTSWAAFVVLLVITALFAFLLTIRKTEPQQ